MPTLSAYFKGATTFAMTGQLALIFLPNHVYTEGYIVSVVTVLLAVLYGFLLIFGKKYDESLVYKGSLCYQDFAATPQPKSQSQNC